MINTKQALSLLLILWTTLIAKAQEAPTLRNQHAIQLNLGISQLTINDRNASPLTYQTRPFQLGLATFAVPPKPNGRLDFRCPIAQTSTPKPIPVG
ncbi:hypothetical protein [Tellurirhabdus bombi]|uniref:hypothetical protein n=1 Tax=Tellurirhabdus bombi TaxID=2907205 RepID=UPI001F45CFEB|nr:hypothetical protein [Tellurirhabdus bombi]